MKRFAELTVVFALILAVSPAAWGQATGEKATGERGRGGRGGGFGPGLLALATQQSVKEELKLTDDQLKVITPLAEKQREGGRGMRDATAEQRQKVQEQIAANEKSLAEVLQPDQLKRLKQIALQQQGALAVARPAVAEDLQLTAEQKDKIKTMQQDVQDKMREAMQAGNREEARSKMTELRKSTNEKVLELFTDEQKTKWKELTGEPFTGEIRLGGDGPRRPVGDAPRRPSGSAPPSSPSP